MYHYNVTDSTFIKSKTDLEHKLYKQLKNKDTITNGVSNKVIFVSLLISHKSGIGGNATYFIATDGNVT